MTKKTVKHIVPEQDFTKKFRFLFILLLLTWLILGIIIKISGLGSKNTLDLSQITASQTADLAKLSTALQQLTVKMGALEKQQTDIRKELDAMLQDNLLKKGRSGDDDTLSQNLNNDKNAALVANASPATLQRFETLAYEHGATTEKLEEANSHANELAAQVSQLNDALAQSRHSVLSGDVLLSAVRLRDAVYNSQRFSGELSVFKRLATPTPALEKDIKTLEAYADQGLTTLPKLREEFSTTADKIAQALRTKNTTNDLTGKAWTELSSLVKIRKIEADGTGTGDEDILARAHQQLEQSNLRQATEELAKLSAASLPLASEWLGKANAVLQSQAASDAIFNYASEAPLVQTTREGNTL